MATIGSGPIDGRDLTPVDGSRRRAVPPSERRGCEDAQKVLATRVGLRLPDELSYEDWEAAGPKLAGVADSAAWCLGDWIVYGQDRFANRYEQALQRADLDYQTLRNYAWVARRFPAARRRENLSMQHHAEVASLLPADQDVWLSRSAEGRWSRNRLRREIRAGREGGGIPGGTRALPRLKVDADMAQRWRRAAERSEVDLHDWIVGVLENAAAVALEGTDARVLPSRTSIT